MSATDIDPFNEGTEGKGKFYAMIVLSFKKLLLDDTFADLIIKVGNETVQAHAAIISSRCEELLGPPQDTQSKKARKKLEVKIKDGAIPPGIITKVLEFLYTGMVDFPKLTDKEILSLVSAARFFKLSRLAYLCERWLREHMTIESVFHLLKVATDLKEERVKGFCLQFALGHYNEFISNKDGIYILGIELFQEVVAAFQTNPTPPQEMRSEDHPDTLLDDFKRMYESMPYSDISFMIRNENIRCHKAVLAAHSEAFVNTIFKDESLVRLTPAAFHTMLRFTYYGDDQVDPLPACELVDFCRKYKLPSLLRICEDKIRCSVAMDTVLPILAIAYLPADGKQDLVEELKSKCFPFILQNLSKVDLKTIQASHPLMVIDLLFELQNAWKNGQHGLGGALPPEFSATNDASLPPASRIAPPSNRAPASPVGNAPVTPPRTATPTLAAPTRPTRTGDHATSGSLLGAQRRGPAPPPRMKSAGGAGPAAGAPPSFPAPPPRGVAPAVPVASPAAPDPSPSPRVADDALSDDGSQSGKKVSKKDRKEEERRKKEEVKRIQKEKKERLKMEKKFKPKSGKDIF